MLNNGSFIGIGADFSSVVPYPVIEYVTGNSQGYAGTTSTISHTLESGMQENDIVVMAFIVASNGNVPEPVPTGYTKLAYVIGLDSYETYLLIAYKFMGATPDTTIEIPNGTTNAAFSGSIATQVFRNVDTTTPIDVAISTGSSPNTAFPTIGNITPISANACIIMGYGSAHREGVQVYTQDDTTGIVSASAEDFADSSVGLSYYVPSGTTEYIPTTPEWLVADDTLASNAWGIFSLNPADIGTGYKNSGIWGIQDGGLIGKKLTDGDPGVWREQNGSFLGQYVDYITSGIWFRE